MHKLLEKYADLNAEYQEIVAERDALRDLIVEEMKKQGVEKQETDSGIFTRAVRKVWSYSDAIKTREENLKIAKKREQEKGVASAKETEYLMFKMPRE